MSETSDVTRPILDVLKQCGIFAMRLNSGKIKARGGWVMLCPEGTGDIIVFPSGWLPQWIETKTLTGASRAKQLEFSEKVTGLGHGYYVMRSLAEVEPYLNIWRARKR